MPIATLDSVRKRDGAGEEKGSGNEYYAGGAGGSSGAGGGSGLAVSAPPTSGGGNHLDDIIARAKSQTASGSTAGAEGARVANVVFYRNGFTVDDGAFRELGVPENDACVESIAQGYCPNELVENGKPASLNVTTRGERTRPAPPVRSILGRGQSLQSTAPADVDRVHAALAAPEAVAVDASKPTVVAAAISRRSNKRIVAVNALRP